MKRIIYSFAGEVKFTGWKIKSTSGIKKGFLTIKVIEQSATRLFILRDFNPHDPTEPPNSVFEMTFDHTGGDDLTALINSATAFYFDENFDHAVLFGDSFLI